MNDTPAAVLAPRPLYVQVRELMIGRMVQGVWKPGAVLPSEVQLAEELGVSQGTVRKALDALAAENLVIRRQGRGTFVAEHDAERALFHFFHMVGDDGSHLLPGSAQLSCRAGRAGREEAGRLDIERGAPVIRLRRTRDLGGASAIYEAISVPAVLFPDLEGMGELPNTLYAFYESRYGVTIVRAEERLRAVEAPAEAARLLGLKPGGPLLEIDRVAFALDGRPAEWRVSLCDTRRHHYLAELL
jgi:GntR family transcriptional regulator